jgi:homoserine O-acetyltransferase/O-succinyltransferase
MTVEVKPAPAKPKVHRSEGLFELESGRTLQGVRLAYRSWGELNAQGTNAVWVLHALTGDSNAVEWWGSLIGPGKVIDTDRYFVLCANMLGSCYGSTGPHTQDARNGAPWYGRFPLLTTRDIVNAFRELRDALGIGQLHAVIGGSMGGQQALEWAVQEPEAMRHTITIAANAFHSPWGIAFNAAQRLALEADPTFILPKDDAGSLGLAAARAMAMITYRSPAALNVQQHDEHRQLMGYRVESYLRYQGRKLVDRFNAHTYHTLTCAMDSHDVGRGRGGAEAVLQKLSTPTLVIGIDSDLLFPVAEQRFISQHAPNAKYREIQSDIGHDGFLLEQDRLGEILQQEKIFL